MPRYSIGIDLGGTNLRAAAFSESGDLLDKVSGSTPVVAGPEAVLNDMAAAAARLRDRFGQESLAGIGAGVPGNIDMAAGIVQSWNNVPAFNGFPMRDQLSRRLGAPVLLENDANAAALGESWVRGNEPNLILLTLGTGVGGGIVWNGRVWHGHIGMAAELGHLTVVPTGNPCGCGNRGCLEKYASATAVSTMARLAGLGDGLTAKDVEILAAQKNARAMAIYSTVGESLGVALAALINTFNFPLYLIGGGMSAAWDRFAPIMLAETERRCLTLRLTKSTTRIERAALGGDAGLYGAGYLSLQSH